MREFDPKICRLISSLARARTRYSVIYIRNKNFDCALQWVPTCKIDLPVLNLDIEETPTNLQPRNF